MSEIIHLSEELLTAVKTIRQAILDARNLYDGHCLAEMSGEKMMVFSEQLKAHRDNDRARNRRPHHSLYNHLLNNNLLNN